MLNWLIFGGTRPNRRMVLGLMCGVLGVAVLIGPAELMGGSQVDMLGAGALIAASLCWSAGSLYSRKAPFPESPLQATAIEMLCGGVVLTLAGTLDGQWADVHPAHISLKSGVAFLYLALFGSMVAFTAYIWLLHHTTPARAASYAYVNPVVAVFLGWALADEELSLRMGIAAAIIVGSVVLITSMGAQQGSRPRSPAAEALAAEASAAK
jgi:drug/metabolite transporter (DMT)-like permease